MSVTRMHGVLCSLVLAVAMPFSGYGNGDELEKIKELSAVESPMGQQIKDLANQAGKLKPGDHVPMRIDVFAGLADCEHFVVPADKKLTLSDAVFGVQQCMKAVSKRLGVEIFVKATPVGPAELSARTEGIGIFVSAAALGGDDSAAALALMNLEHSLAIRGGRLMGFQAGVFLSPSQYACKEKGRCSGQCKHKEKCKGHDKCKCKEKIKASSLQTVLDSCPNKNGKPIWVRTAQDFIGTFGDCLLNEPNGPILAICPADRGDEPPNRQEPPSQKEITVRVITIAPEAIEESMRGFVQLVSFHAPHQYTRVLILAERPKLDIRRD